MVYFMENPIKKDDLGIPLFQETTMAYLLIWISLDVFTGT